MAMASLRYRQQRLIPLLYWWLSALSCCDGRTWLDVIDTTLYRSAVFDPARDALQYEFNPFAKSNSTISLDEQVDNTTSFFPSLSPTRLVYGGQWSPSHETVLTQVPAPTWAIEGAQLNISEETTSQSPTRSKLHGGGAVGNNLDFSESPTPTPSSPPSGSGMQGGGAIGYVSSGTNAPSNTDSNLSEQPSLSSETFVPSAQESSTGTPTQAEIPSCDPNQSLYIVRMGDSWGDGWNGSKMKIYIASSSSSGVDYELLQGNEDNKTKNYDSKSHVSLISEVVHTHQTSAGSDADNVVFDGTLANGWAGQSYVCLEPRICYHIVVDGGDWEEEIKWDIRSFNTVEYPVAKGVAPVQCQFSIPDLFSGRYDCPHACNLREPLVAPRPTPTEAPTVLSGPLGNQHDLSGVPSDEPSLVPVSYEDVGNRLTMPPSDVPSLLPSSYDSSQPHLPADSWESNSPSTYPSDAPSLLPSDAPSLLPSHAPSEAHTTSNEVESAEKPTNAPFAFASAFPSDVASDISSNWASSMPSSWSSDTPSASISLSTSVLTTAASSNLDTTSPSASSSLVSTSMSSPSRSRSGWSTSTTSPYPSMSPWPTQSPAPSSGDAPWPTSAWWLNWLYSPDPTPYPASRLSALKPTPSTAWTSSPGSNSESPTSSPTLSELPTIVVPSVQIPTRSPSLRPSSQSFGQNSLNTYTLKDGWAAIYPSPTSTPSHSPSTTVHRITTIWDEGGGDEGQLSMSKDLTSDAPSSGLTQPRF